MSAKKLISIVTPCYNEEENVENHFARVLKMIAPFRDRYDFEHIYTDNCSTDRTFELLNQLHEKTPAVKVLRFSRNIGGDKAMFFGLQHATGDAVVLIQADLQDPPEMIPTFIENWEQGCDVVYGKIMKRDEGRILQSTRKLFYRIIRALSDVPIPTDAGDFRLTSRRALDAILQFKENDLYMRGAVAQVGFLQKGIEYVRADREGGHSSVNLIYLIGYAINGLLSTTLAPIRAVSILGFVMSFFGFLATAVLVFGRIFFSSNSPHGFTTLACLITLFAGVQVLSIGIIGEYLRKTYVQTLQRPRGFVRGQDWFLMNLSAGIVQEDLAEILSANLDFSRFFGKTLLITGASGFLPAYMVETLLRLNDQKLGAPVKVLGLVRNRARANARFAKYLGRADLELIEQDVSNFEPVAGPVHFIVHAASQASPKYYGTDPVGTLLPNTLGTLKLLQFAQTQPLESFLFFSSGEVYGILPTALIPNDEKTYGYVDPMNVRSCYGESKRLGENMCVSFAHQYQVPARVVRPFHTYGPGMLLDDGRVFSDFVANVVNGKNIEMKSDGSAIRPYCYLADAVRGFFTILLKGEVGEAYNVGNDQAELSVLELAELLVGLYPAKNLKVERKSAPTGVVYLQSKISRNCPNIQKMKILGWQPKYNPKEGFSRTIQSFLEQGSNRES